jgi:hypothetical protein
MNYLIKILNNIGMLSLVIAFIILANKLFKFQINIKGHRIPEDYETIVLFAIAGFVLLGISKLIFKVKNKGT